MVLLSSSVRQSNAQPLKLQALEGWQALVNALAKEAPHQLADMAHQVPSPPPGFRQKICSQMMRPAPWTHTERLAGCCTKQDAVTAGNVLPSKDMLRSLFQAPCHMLADNV